MLRHKITLFGHMKSQNDIAEGSFTSPHFLSENVTTSMRLTRGKSQYFSRGEGRGTALTLAL